MNHGALCVGLAFISNSQVIGEWRAPGAEQPIPTAQIFGTKDTISSKVIQPFSYENWDAASGFLSDHERVRSILPSVRTKVNEVFGATTEILIRVSNDYESGTARLVAQILFPGDLDEALSRFSAFGRQWWYLQPSFVDGDLVMDIEVV